MLRLLRLLCRLAWTLGSLAVADSTCLPDAINASQRRNLTQPTGESYPVGVWVNDWAAGHVTSALAKILIEEKLGYNTVETGPGPGTLNAFYALMGCTTPNSLSDRGCGPSITYNHVNMEAWGETYASEWSQIQAQFPSLAPVDVGSMGYPGKTALFFPQDSRLRAYEEDGAVLDFFRGWNATHSQPFKFFQDIGSISRDKVRRCSDTRFWISAPNEEYLRLTGDTGGVQRLASNELVALCPDDYFWHAPACRSNASRCVPYITGGSGWQLDEVMQKSAFFNMPLAIGVAESWSTLPLEVASTFYWWTPDPTFLDLDPVEIVFPPYDFNAWINLGDKRTAISASRVTKIVSQDLASLAPNVGDLIRNVRLHVNDVNSMMRDRQLTGDSHLDAACRWLRSNPSSWETWLPDKTKCFPGFGLYDINLQGFVTGRENPTYLECRACESGTFSSQLDDASGVTHVCTPCPAGASQASGAALACEECQLGEYQNQVGSQTCKRCEIGTFQDERGAAACTLCPPGGTTLGLGSISLTDCGCSTGYLDTSTGMENLSCVKCGTGMNCPSMSTLASLASGAAALGDQFVPRVLESFYSTPEQPMEVYRCVEGLRCPGGVPGTCKGGLHGVACTDCVPGSTFNGQECEECGPFRVIGWIVAIVALFGGLVVAYYVLTSQATAKASVLFTTTCAFGMVIAMLQSVGIIGMMTVDFPFQLKGLLEFLQIFVLDIDQFAFTCVAGTDAALKYTFSALFFPAGVLWLMLAFFVSKLLPQKHRWDAAKVCSTIGQFCQVGFSTMSTIALKPLMCFSHPNGVTSVLKSPSVTCGTAEHTTMVVVGMLLLVLGVLGFLSVCSYAAVMAPAWSNRGHHFKVKCFRFLVFRFRLDSWWYGVPLLTRGPLLSLPIALATDYPPVQVMLVQFVLIMFLTVEVRAWPWKVPLLNVIDCVMSICIVFMVASSALHLGLLDEGMTDFANTLSSVVMGFMGCMMIVLMGATGSALFFKSALGSQQEPFIFTLQRTPPADQMALQLRSLAKSLVQKEEIALEQALRGLSIFDMNALRSSMALLASEVTQDSLGTIFQSRISSSSFAVKAKPKPQAPSPAKAPVEVAETAEEPVKPWGEPVLKAEI